MKKLKTEQIVIILAVISAVFMLGFFAGRNLIGRRSAAEYVSPQLKEPEISAPSETEDGEPEQTAEQLPEQTQEPELKDLNSATREELEEIPGIGSELAGRILEYREKYGPFGAIEELTEVNGIGEKKLEAVKTRMTVR